MKPKNRQNKLAARIKDFATMKMRFPGMYRKPGSNKK